MFQLQKFLFRDFGWQFIRLAVGLAILVGSTEVGAATGVAKPAIGATASSAKACTIIIRLKPGPYPNLREVTFPKIRKTPVMVGHRIRLSAEVRDPQGEPLMEVTGNWTIPGEKVQNWVADADSARVVEVPPAALEHQSEVDFCWVKAGTYRVEYAVEVADKPYRAMAVFEVSSPSVKVTTVTNKVLVSDEFVLERGFYLHFGFVATDGSAGINFTRLPATVAKGQLAWLQLLVRSESLVSPSGTTQRYRDEAMGLDVLPYRESWEFITYGMPHRTLDSPGFPLNFLLQDFPQAEVVHFKTENDFEMFTMFKPEGTGSIWVPLNKIAWSWSGTAIHVRSRGWTGGGENTVNPVSVPTTIHPVWSQKVREFITLKPVK